MTVSVVDCLHFDIHFQMFDKSSARSKLKEATSPGLSPGPPATVFPFPMSQETLDKFGQGAFQILSGKLSIIVVTENLVFKHYLSARNETRIRSLKT